MPTQATTYPGSVLSTILRHDAKNTSYKIALLRALADVALAFPGVGSAGLPVAVPLEALAEFWIAYYWPFAHPARPIIQGRSTRRATGQSSDIAFRGPLARLVLAWEDFLGAASAPSDGYLAVSDLRLRHKRDQYPPSLTHTYDHALKSVASTITQPVHYAGPGEWTVFAPPTPLTRLSGQATPIPNAREDAPCVVVPPDLWRDFEQLSLWVEALCIHEWCLFTERLDQPGGVPATRGAIYELLTDRPDNRRPLTWERNRIDILLMEGNEFQCPWTRRRITAHSQYDLDHIIPVSVYPMNELWNLVPSDPRFNQHTKRDRLPSQERLSRAIPILSAAYAAYLTAPELACALRGDAAARFAEVAQPLTGLPLTIARATASFVERVAQSRNLARF